MRSILVCLDGTWNGRDDDVPTNILKLHEAAGLTAPETISLYFEGPGNDSKWLTKIFGGAFGAGSMDIRDQAYSALESVYQPDDKIVIIGFSRGAAIARLLCSKIHKFGINDHYPPVNFLGCFDTVGAFLPVGHFQQGALFHDLHISPGVERAFHAVSIDENRLSFEPNLMNNRNGIAEVWFPGGHSDIGGGNSSSGLSDITLDWMLEKMTKCGLDAPQLDVDPGPTAGITIVRGMYRRGPRRVGVKVDGEFNIAYKPRIHRSVAVRQESFPEYQPSLRNSTL